MSSSFEKERHIRYFHHCLRQLPGAYSSLDTSRLTLVHFSVQALDVLGQKVDPHPIVEWIYSLQDAKGGFTGGNFISEQKYRYGHIAMTYTALCTLKTLGDDLNRVNKEGILALLKVLQRKDGSFQCIPVGSEYDMRFLYCACAISFILDDWSGVDVESAVSFVKNCRSFDGAISLIPHQEGHGGSTFCGVASLKLMKKMHVLKESNWRRDLIYWCTSRQVGGMQGQPNKPEDTCYSYWIGGTLRMLQQDHLLDQDALRTYVLTCQNARFGGFGKILGAQPDVLHSFYSLAWLSLSSKHMENVGGLKKLNCVLGVVEREGEVVEE